MSTKAKKAKAARFMLVRWAEASSDEVPHDGDSATMIREAHKTAKSRSNQHPGHLVQIQDSKGNVVQTYVDGVKQKGAKTPRPKTNPKRKRAP